MVQNRNAKRAFDSVCELAADPGLIGLALNQLAAMLGPALIPDSLLREADRWENPWKFLNGVRDLPKNFKKVFEAGDSQRQALLRFSRKAQRTGSLNTSWYDRLVAARARHDSRAERTAMKKIFAGMYRTDRGHFLLGAAKRRPEFLAQIQEWIDELYARDVRRLGRRKANEKPNRPRIADCSRTYVACDRIAFAMTCGWLRGDKHGFPGLCFCSDEVIAALLRRMLNLPTLGIGTIRKLRQRLKLKKAVVLIRDFCPSVQRQFELLGPDGKPIWRGVLVNSTGEEILPPDK